MAFVVLQSSRLRHIGPIQRDYAFEESKRLLVLPRDRCLSWTIISLVLALGATLGPNRLVLVPSPIISERGRRKVMTVRIRPDPGGLDSPIDVTL